jgi:hypothetical protein
MSDTHDAMASAPAEAASLSLFERAVAVFTRPTQAWGGLRERAQWWFPTLLLTVVSVGITLALHQRALIPMMMEAWDQQVADGNMRPEQVDSVVAFMSGPLGMTLTAVQQAVVIPFIVLLTGLVVWFGAGFVLGTGLKFRLALEVAAWSCLVTIPGYLLTAVLAWIRETMRGVHVGFGALLPALDEPTKLGIALRSFLDAIGPLSIWFVVGGVIGAAALSGAPRKSVAWVLGVLYVAIALFMSAMAAMFAPGT